MHPSFRLFPALLSLGLSSDALLDLGISGHETHPSGLHKTQATAGFGQSLPSPYFACATRRGRWGQKQRDR